MRPAAALEQFLERLFERIPARVFRARVQPIQIQRRVERAMEMERRVSGGRIDVPSRFTVHLCPGDLTGDHSKVASELADAALAFAHRHGYRLAERPAVRIASDPQVEPGDMRVRAWFRDSPGSVAADAPGAELEGGGVPRRPAVDARAAQTAALPVPKRPSIAVLRVVTPDVGPIEPLPLDGAPIRIGRAPDNDLVLADGRISRHHARIQGRAGVLVLTDLESTNGSFVNGRRAHEVVLGDGDRLQFGGTVLSIERPAGGPWTEP